MNAFKEYVSNFPEALYPSKQDAVTYYNNVTILGRQKASESSVIICGICRDAEKNLKFNVPRIERIGELFNDYKVVVYENDSKDLTKDILEIWQKSNPRVTVITETLGDKKFGSVASFERANALADCRNKYLKLVNDTIDSDYVIMLDMDIEGGWSYEGICNSLGHTDWDMIGSNGILYGPVDENNNMIDKSDSYGRVYYDTYAFRRVGHPKPHSSQEINQLFYNRGEPFIKVMSCFGGLGIYKRDAIRDIWYSSQKPDSAACEHVYFHMDMAKNGFDRIYLNPSQITLYSSNPYTYI